MSKPPIIYFGNEQLAQGLDRPITPILDALIAQDYPLKAIFTNYNPTQKSRSKAIPRPIQVASDHNIPIYTPHGKQALLDALQPLITQFDQPPIGILAAYNIIIPPAVLDLFEPIGILNLHPSLLPKYRGSTPIETAILNDDRETGVSIMKLSPAMDAGPLYAQVKVPIGERTTKQQLYETLATTGATELLNLLPIISTKTPTPQTANPTFTTKLDKSLSLLDPSKKPAPTLEREIRAFANFPKSKLALLDIPCTITSAHVATQPSSPLDPKCADGNYLVIDQLIPANGKKMTAQEFLNGHAR